MRQLLRIRDARIYLFGDVVSSLGDSALWLAMAIWLKEMTGSSAYAGLVMFAFAAGNLLSPVGGMVADRFRRRPLLIACNLISAAVVLPIVLVHGRSQMWVVYLVMFAYGAIGSTISAAQTAILPTLVPEDLLASANGTQQTLNQGLRLVAPLLGAGLFALVGGAAVAEIDAATFVVAAVAMLALRTVETAPVRVPGGEHAVTAGFRFLGGEPVLRSITVALSVAMLVLGFTESAGFSVVTVGLHHAASFVGVLSTIQGLGAIAGGLSAAAVLRRVSERVMTALALASAAVAVLLLTLPLMATAAAGMVVAGLVGPWVSVAAITAIQRRTPATVMGRVSGAFGLALTVPQVVSVGLGAALIALVDYRILLVVVAVVVVAAMAPLAMGRDVRPDPVMEPGDDHDAAIRAAAMAATGPVAAPADAVPSQVVPPAGVGVVPPVGG